MVIKAEKSDDISTGKNNMVRHDTIPTKIHKKLDVLLLKGDLAHFNA